VVVVIDGREAGATEAHAILKPYVPRLVINWLRDTPDARHLALESSLVFVDISGFTALSERLAKKGKIGAELMRDTLDGVFTALLDEAYDWGAGLLKWGGDALLLMFDGPGHQARACRAAWEMQRVIERVGRLHVSGGTITLRMSVGVGTGRYHFFMTGSVHRELLIAGPAMTETLVVEGIADAGEIGLTAALAALLDPRCVGAPREEAILLAEPPDAVRERAPDVGDVSTIDIASCIPVATRAHVMQEKKPEPEHRTITAAFIDLMDTDRLLAELGPEELALALDVRMTAIQEAALRYEVPFYETDVGKSSVKALLTAGAPSSTGHDEERMLRALRDVMDQAGVVPMRVGVNTGKVFTGDFGPPYRRAYRVFGDAINTAARVMSKAAAGQILSTEIVLERSRTQFEATPIEPFAAKGKSQPVRASIVGAALGMKQSGRGQLPLVGRDAELDAVLGVLEQVRFGTGWAVEIAGEPGVGKSRFVEEVIARALDFRLLRSRCEEYEQSTPYFPMRAIVRSVLGLEPDEDLDAGRAEGLLAAAIADSNPGLAPWIPLLGLLLGLELPHTPQTKALEAAYIGERLAEVTADFLALALPMTPAIILLEDAQHIDEATRDLVQRLARSVGLSRWLLVITRDSGAPILGAPGPSDRVIGIHLAPLTQAQMEELVNVLTEDDPLRPDEVEELARRAAGNSLFLLELLDGVRKSGSLEALPDSVEALIAGQIDQLAPADRTILRYAAVLGQQVEPDLLQAAVRGEVDLDGGAWSRLRGLLDPDESGVLRFRNALVRDAAYEGLPYRRRRALHERAGTVIEERVRASPEDDLGVLAWHFHEAQRWDKAWRYSGQAADRAAKIHAVADASRFYERAILAGRHLRHVRGPELADTYVRWSDVLDLLGRHDDADHALRLASRHVADPAQASRIAIKRARAAMKTGRYRRGSLLVRRALRALDGYRGREVAASRARLMVMHAINCWYQTRRHDAISWARSAIPVARRSGAGDALAQAYQLLDNALREIGQPHKAVYSPRALVLYQQLGSLREQALVLNNMGGIAYDRSSWEEALGLYRRSLEITEMIGDRGNASIAKYNIAEILSDQGRLDEAEELLREVVRVWRATGADADVAEARRELGKIQARRGEFATAAELLEAAEEEQLRSGKPGEVLATRMRMSELAVLAGKGVDALERVEAVIRQAERTDSGSYFLPSLRRLRGWALAQAGELGSAERQLDEALVSARRRSDDYETALVLDALTSVRRARGATVADLEAERSRYAEKLGIMAMPSFPVASSAGA